MKRIINKEIKGNKERDTKYLRGSIYDLHPQEKGLRATFALTHSIFLQYKRLIFVGELW